MVFGTFSKMVSHLPAQAVLKALELEANMLEEDVAQRRITMEGDAFSILCFREFVWMAKAGGIMQAVEGLPPDHVAFYKETIVRLVQEGELPGSAMDKFDKVFKF